MLLIEIKSIWSAKPYRYVLGKNSEQRRGVLLQKLSKFKLMCTLYIGTCRQNVSLQHLTNQYSFNCQKSKLYHKKRTLHQFNWYNRWAKLALEALFLRDCVYIYLINKMQTCRRRTRLMSNFTFRQCCQETIHCLSLVGQHHPLTSLPGLEYRAITSESYVHKSSAFYFD